MRLKYIINIKRHNMTLEMQGLAVL